MAISDRSWVAALVLLAACGTGEEPLESTVQAESAGRAVDPRAVSLREAIEDGEAERARVLLDQVESRLGAEGPCLRARIAALEGNVLEALRELESARRRWPEDPRPAATSVEIYAQFGRLEAAMDEYNRGVAVFGRGPELTRAQGILALVTPGAAISAAEMLEEARRDDERLPFVDEPLAQARWMAARLILAQGDVERAEGLARGALELAPADPDARITLADCLKGQGDFEGAIPWLESLVDEGVAVEDELAELHHAAATRAMLEGDRGRQLDHYLGAREHGYTDEQLGHGAQALRQAANGAIDAGLELQQQAQELTATGAPFEDSLERLRAAEAEYRRALVYDPNTIEASHRLATVLFKQARFRDAALAWEAALARARVADLVVPEEVPLEINAALAWEEAERPDLARARLLEYLERAPEGAHVDRALAQLERLEGQ